MGNETTPDVKMLNSFSIFNVRGLKPKTVQSKVPYVKDFLTINTNDFGILSETWLREHKDAEIHIDGYKIFRADRKRRKTRFGRSSGGVAIYMKETFAATFKEMLSFSDGVNELLIIYSQTYNTIIGGLYRQPDDKAHGNPSTNKEFKELLSTLKKKIDNLPGKMPDIFIAGDFNLPHIDWLNDSFKPGITNDEKLMANQLFELMNDFSLLQLINTPTHKEGNTLDLLLTNNIQLIHSFETIPTINLSDHHMINVKTHLKFNKDTTAINSSNPRNVFDQYNFYSNKVKWDEIDDKLKETSWDDLENETPETQIAKITEKVLNAVKDHAPKRIWSVKCQKRIPRDRRILFRKRKKTLSKKFTKDSKKIQQKLQDIEYKLTQSYKNEEQLNEQKAVNAIKSNPKYFYSYTKQHSKVKTKVGPLLNKDKVLVTNNKEMANVLQKQYQSAFSQPLDTYHTYPSKCANTLEDLDFDETDIVEAINSISQNSSPGPDGFPAILLKKCKEALAKPIKIFWRTCLDSGTTINLHKTNNITPIFKGGDQGEASNYRPVSLTSHLTKIFEKIVRKSIIQHFDENDLFNSSQHGFREGRSCLSQLLTHFDSVLTELEEGKDVDVIYIDFSKAFDKVDHTILMNKLKAVGLNGKLLAWIESFLTKRKQIVVVDGESSEAAETISGVPQGSVLGPLLFIIMIGDINENVEYSTLSSFADDTRLKKAIQNLLDTFKLQADLNHIYKWALDNNMMLNGKKFEHIHYGKNNKSNGYFTEHSKIIEEKSTVKDLGVVLTDDTSFKQHINNMIKKATELIGWVLRTFKSRSKEVMTTLWKSLIIPHLDYCSQLWNPQEKGLIQEIEAVQRSFTRQINSVKSLSYWERLKELGMYSLQRRRERYIIIYTWSILEGLVPNIVTDETEAKGIFSYSNERQGRKCFIPLIKRSPFQSQVYASIRMQGPKLFNCLPKDLRNLTNCKKEVFKGKLDRYLRTVPDEPLVSGYTNLRRAESNSIAHMTALVSTR